MRQVIRGQCREQTQPQHAVRRISAASGHGADLVDIAEHQARPLGDFFSDRCQHDVLGRALHQLDAQFVFQLLDLRAERGLTHETGVCGFAEMAQVGQLDEILQGAKIHRAIILTLQ